MAEDAVIRLGYDNAKVRAGAAQTEQIMSTTAAKVQSKVAAINGAGRGAGNAGLRNAGGVAMQVQDIAVQLQSGTAAMTVFAQQGSQLASLFGPTGMIIGGVAALAGVAYTVGQKGKEAFDAMITGADELHKQTGRLLSTGGLTDIISATEQITAAAEAMNAELAKGATFTGSAQALLGGDLPQDRMNELARKQSQAEFDRQKLAIRSLEVAQQEAELAEMRAQGRTKEADEIERQLDLQRQIARIEQMPFSDKTKAGLKEAATRVSDAQAAGEQRAEDERLNKEEQRKRASRESLAADLAAMEARARGQEKLAQQIERTQAIKERGAQIAQQLGIGEADAAGIAAKEAAMQDKIKGQGRGKITSSRAGLDQPWGIGATNFSGLDEFQRLQRGGRGERKFGAFGQEEPLDFMLRSRRGLKQGDTIRTPSGKTMIHGEERKGGSNSGGKVEELMSESRALLERIANALTNLD